MLHISTSKMVYTAPKFKHLSNKIGVLRKHFCSKVNVDKQYPFKFNGFDESFFLNLKDQELQTSINYLFNKNPIKKGMFVAYNNYIDALLEGDQVYLEDVCESGMFSRVNESIVNLDASDYYVEAGESEVTNF